MSSTQEKRCRTCVHWGLDMICQNEDSGEQGYTCMAGAACGHWEGTGEPEVRHGQHDEDKPLTNGDRIRQMTDEELAEFFCQISQCCGNDASCSMCPIYDGCAQNVMCVERWLKQDATDTNVGGKGGDDNVSDV